METRRSADHWQLRTQRLSTSPTPLVMGIINVTPDSFSDGGCFFEPSQAIVQGMQLVADGAAILDVGGESTRPNATPVDADEELRRVLPVVQGLRAATDVPISIDTTKAAVAAAAVAAGAEIINDVTGLEGDPDMVAVARQSRVGVCVMHMLGTPRTMQNDPQYDDVVKTVTNYLAGRRDALVAAGIDLHRICLDPGIGFGKTTAHNLELLRNVHRLTALDCPVLIGHSRKGFIGRVLNDADTDRTAGTIGVALAAAAQGAAVIRVHDVRPVREALTLFIACGGVGGDVSDDSRSAFP